MSLRSILERLDCASRWHRRRAKKARGPADRSTLKMATAANKPDHRARRVIASAIGVVVAALLLELVLQVAALVMHLRNSDVHAAAGGGAATRVVLCVGDSFTFGLHATSPAFSYPSLAQSLVDARGGEATQFVNRGVPGQSSRDVLLRLDEDLSQHKPKVVYVLVGTNDHTFRPTLVKAEELASARTPGFAWRLRTWRLLQLMTNSGSEADAQHGLPFVGVWHANQVEFEFTADGVMRLGDQRWPWSFATDGGLRVGLPDGRQLPIEWRREGARLHVACALWDPPLLFEPGPMPGPASAVLREHLRQIVDKVRAAGARCVLLTYPGGAFARQGLNDELRAAAREYGAELLDVEARFSELAKDGDIARYYVADGHCSDLGNEEIAKLCAADAQR